MFMSRISRFICASMMATFVELRPWRAWQRGRDRGGEAVARRAVHEEFWRFYGYRGCDGEYAGAPGLRRGRGHRADL
jgi:hypothetical protein